MRTLLLVLATSSLTIFAQELTRPSGKVQMGPGFAPDSSTPQVQLPPQPPKQGSTGVLPKSGLITIEAGLAQRRCSVPLLAAQISLDAKMPTAQIMPGETKDGMPKVTLPAPPCDTVSTTPMPKPGPVPAPAK